MRHTLIFLCFLTTSCQYFQQKDTLADSEIARAHDQYFYKNDLKRLLPININKEDSAKLSSRVIQDWIKKELLINKINNQGGVNEDDIEAKVKEYRYSLLIHEFEKFYIDANVETDIDEEEIQQYYTKMANNFILRQNIVKCLFVKVPNSAPDIRKLRRNMRAFPGSPKEDIEDYSFQYAISSFLDDSLWVNFDDVIGNTPLQNTADKMRFLNNTTFSETTDENFTYLLRILEFKISNELSPLEFIREDIENIIINKRKLELKRELEKAIYDEALINNSFEIYGS